MRPAPRTLGQRGEQTAAEHLIARGYTIVARNVRTRLGELDLIAEPTDRRLWVVVEVKAGVACDGYPPHVHVNPGKQHKLVSLAAQLLRQRRLPDRPVRFDVISVVFDGDGLPHVTHIPGAFTSMI